MGDQEPGVVQLAVVDQGQVLGPHDDPVASEEVFGFQDRSLLVQATGQGRGGGEGSLGPDHSQSQIAVAVQAAQTLLVQPVAAGQVESVAAQGHGAGAGQREEGFFRGSGSHESLTAAGTGQQGVQLGIQGSVRAPEMAAADGASLIILDQQHVQIHERHLPGREIQYVTAFVLVSADGAEAEVVVVGYGLGQLVQQGGQFAALSGQIVSHDADLIVHA